MTARRILSFLQTGWTKLVDGKREERLQEATALVSKYLAKQREAFDYNAVFNQLELVDEERQEVAEKVYLSCLARAWADEVITAQEQKSLAVVAHRLRIPEPTAHHLQRLQAESIFGTKLAEAFADGHLDDKEFATLKTIASSCGATPAEFFRSRFRGESEGFLRNLFIKVLEDGRLDEADWRTLLKTIQQLGMTESEFKEAIQVPAQQFVEHLLADFKSDGDISAEESQCLNWMLRYLIASPPFEDYVQEQVSETQHRARLRSGILPSLPAPTGLSLRSGEITHFHGRCAFTFQRRKAGQYVPETIIGYATITDDRMIFTATEKSLQTIHSKILGYQPSRRGMEIQCSGTSAGLYEFRENAEDGVDIWISAIRKATQTLVVPAEDKSVRYISRDIRQRVWQRYGGRCAECNSTQYLEFDHIIPVARGGGNSDNNIQLLCRRCNLSKSDNI